MKPKKVATNQETREGHGLFWGDPDNIGGRRCTPEFRGRSASNPLLQYNMVLEGRLLNLAGWPRTEPEPETRTFGTVFAGTERGSGTVNWSSCSRTEAGTEPYLSVKPC